MFAAGAAYKRQLFHVDSVYSALPATPKVNVTQVSVRPINHQKHIPVQVEYAPYSRILIRHTAHHLLSFKQRLLLLVCAEILFIPFIFSINATLRVYISLLSAFYFFNLCFGFWLLMRALRRSPEIRISRSTLQGVQKNNLPLYTILCPLFREAEVVPQFVEAMQALRYPTDKLQILLLLEEHDKKTIKAIERLCLPSYFETVLIPHGAPQTKPRACNVGLQHAQGKYVVIYDAEDIPETDQLLKTVTAFSDLPPDTACLQAKLDFYNPHHNLLTRFFTAEYALLFSLTLPGLQSLNGPIPLGGTSNHFRIEALRHIGGWDPFNVTEDCDLGIRLFTHGYRTAILDSTTHEEANSRIGNWLRQRSRWIKGYLQTLIVHTRSPQVFFQSLRTIPHFGTFLIMVGGQTITTMINPFLWVATLLYFIGPSFFREWVQSIYLTPVLYLAATSCVAGNFMYVFFFLVGMWQRGYPELVKYSPLIPFYWLMMSLAGWKAIWQLIRRPHYWEKTVHGFHLVEKPNRKHFLNYLYHHAH